MSYTKEVLKEICTRKLQVQKKVKLIIIPKLNVKKYKSMDMLDMKIVDKINASKKLK